MPGDARHHGLAAELAFGADFARHARDFRREAVQLIHHRVDGVLELENLAFHVDRDLARQVAAGDGRRHLGDVADLRREVRAHRIDRVGEVLPGAGDVGHFRAAAELAFRADFARHAAHFRGERVQLIHHRVDGVLELENLTFDVDRDLARQVAAGDGGRDAGDVSHLRGEVRRHGVDRVGEVLPGAGDARHDGLAAQLAVGAHFARDARHFGGEAAQLVHHRVDGFLQLQNFAADVDGDFLREVAVRHRDRHVGDVADLRGEVAGHLVDRLGQLFPHARHAAHLRLTAEFAFGADLARDARHFRGEHRQLVDHLVHQLRGSQELAFERTTVDFERHRLSEIAFRHGADRARHFRRRPHQVVDEHVDGGHFVGPATNHTRHDHALFELAFLADGVRDAGGFARAPFADGRDVVEHVGDFSVDADQVGGQPNAEVAVAKRKQSFKKCFGERRGRVAGF